MDAQPRTASSPWLHASGPIPWARWGLGAALSLLWMVALVVGLRRMAGGLVVPLPTHWLVVLAALLAVLARGIDSLDAHLAAVRAGPRAATIPWAVRAALLVVAITLALPKTAPLGLGLFWLLLLAPDASALLGRAWHARPRQQDRSAHPLPPQHDPIPQHGSAEPRVLQQVGRVRLASGLDELEGVFRAEMAAGQRTAMIHVAFCPPFAGSPELNVQQLDGPPARIKQGPVHPFGVRLEVRTVDAAAEPVDVLVRVTALGEPVEA